MNQKLGAFKRSSGCKKLILILIIEVAIFGAICLYALISVQKNAPDSLLFSVLAFLYTLLSFAIAANWIVVYLRCKLFVYENGLSFTIPVAPFTLKTKTILFDDIISAEYKYRGWWPGDLLVLHTNSDDYVLRYFQAKEMNSLYDFLRLRGIVSG